MPEVSSSTWAADSTCFQINLNSNLDESFQLMLHLSGKFLTNSTRINSTELQLLTGYYLVLGSRNENQKVKLIAHDVAINFTQGYAI
jgi:hypothetical protein